jgi:D-alanine-D-alanine ligase
MSDPLPKIALIFGGVSPEHKVSISSASKVAEGLIELSARNPIDVQAIYIDREAQWVWLHPAANAMPREADLARAEDWALRPDEFRATVLPFPAALQRLVNEQTDVAMIMLHGQAGEDGRLQAALDLAGIAYTGSGAAASSLALNKVRSQALLRALGLPVPACVIIRAGDADAPGRIAQSVGVPCVVKPSTGGSSVGVAIVREADRLAEALETAFQVDDELLVEQFVAGREFTVGLLEVKGELVALPVTEIIPPEGRFFDYDAKYTPGVSREVTPAEIPSTLAAELRHFARAAHLACGCRGFSRVDFIALPAPPVILEVNTIPGMTATSLLPQGAAAAGIAFPDLLHHLLVSARYDR